MKTRRVSSRVGFAIAFLIVLAIGVAWMRQRQSERVAAQREAGYAAAVEAYARRMAPGLTREEVEHQLRAEGKEFFHMCCMGVNHNAFDTLVKIGEESPPWYCSEHYVYVGFEFVSNGTHDVPEARDADRLTTVRLFKHLTGCV
jgi:hypothetical protein